MTKHAIRCGVCNKFVTRADQADDGMCLSCALRLDMLVDERTKRYQRQCFFLLVLAIVMFIFALARGASAFQVEYFVTGMNTTTNERVVGWLDGTIGEAQVQGHVLDRGEHYAVVGVIAGKGLFELRSMCCLYEVETADEISSSKLVNRKNNPEAK